MNLYEITEEFKAILDNCEDMNDEELGNALFEVNADFTDKVENCVYYIKNQESDITAIDAEIKRLQDRKAAKQNKINSLKKYVQSGMETMLREKIEYPQFSIRVQKNPPSVQITNEELIPAEFRTVKTIESIDKKSIKEAGGCPGAEIVQTKGLRIK